MWCSRRLPEHLVVRGIAAVFFLIGLALAYASFTSGERIVPFFVFFIAAGVASLVAALASRHPRWFLLGGIWSITLPFGLMQSPWFLLLGGVLSLLLGLSSWLGRERSAPAPDDLTSEQYQPYQEGYLPVQHSTAVQHEEHRSPPVPQYEQPQASYPELPR